MGLSDLINRSADALVPSQVSVQGRTPCALLNEGL